MPRVAMRQAPAFLHRKRTPELRWELYFNSRQLHNQGPKTKNVVHNNSKPINSLDRIIGIGEACRAPIPRTFMYVIRKKMLIDENCNKSFLIFWKNYNTRLFFKC
jgi:hypothetical protein